MRLTPLEIRKQTFSRRRLGGIDSEEVQDFLNLVASELEELLRDNALAGERLTQADQKIHEFRSMEETLRRTLVRAEQLKNESKENARRECELVLQEARLRAERVLEDARNRLRQLTDEIEELQKKKEVFLHRFRSLVSMQMELLDQHHQDYEDVSRISREAHTALERHSRPIEVPRVSDVTGRASTRARDDDGERGGTGHAAEPVANDDALFELSSDDEARS
jgi:cell division initiation protein